MYVVDNTKCLCISSYFSDSNHFGIAGWYSMRASDQGCLVSMAHARI